MKKFPQRIVIFVSLVSMLFAQNGEILDIQLEKNEANSKPQTIQARIQVDAASSDGIFVELPEGLTAVVHSATLNGNTLWLINSDQQVSANNVLGWQLRGDGIVLHYSSAFSGQLNVEIAPDSARLNRYDQIDINIHLVTRNNTRLDIDNAIVARSNLIIKPSTPTDEE